MKKILFVLLLSASTSCWAQQGRNTSAPIKESVNRFGVYGGMGVGAAYAPSVVDYLNAVNQYASQVGNVATAVEFFAGCELPVSRAWGIKAEHSLLFKSYTLDGTSFGTLDLRYDVQAPSLMAQYVVAGGGYFLKFGAGGGYHWGKVTVNTSIYGQETVYTAHGIGGKAEAEGQTAFDEHLYGYIGLSLGFEAMGKVTSDARGELAAGGTAVRLNYTTAGLRFGLMYYF